MRPGLAETKYQWLRPASGPALALVLLSVSAANFSGAPLLVQLPALLFCGLVIAVKDAEAWPAAALLFFLFVGMRLLPSLLWLVPTAGFFLPLLFAWGASRIWKASAQEWRWLRRGSLDLGTCLLAAATSLTSAAALLFWAFWTDNLGVGASLLREFGGVPRWFLFVVGVPGFALLNAFIEEAIFRGVLLEALRKKFPGRPALALGLQASAFAAVHFVAGFPNGKLGYLMTFVYACALGQIRIRAGGLLAAFLTHVVADLVIGIILLLLAH